jgi:prepilin-type processing-associated H-X9-DG protein
LAGNVKGMQNIILTQFAFSQHPGGCHFAFADGSVQFLSENMNLAVYQSLGAMADGLPLGGLGQ